MIERFIGMLFKELTHAKVVLFLREDGTWESIGVPDNLFYQPPTPSTNFVEEHNTTSGPKTGAWWEKD